MVKRKTKKHRFHSRRKTVAQMREECRAQGLVYDTKTKQCRPSKRPGSRKTSKRKTGRKSRSRRKTVAQMRKECRTWGLVYDTKTKQCRPSKRPGRRSSRKTSKRKTGRKSRSRRKTVAQMREECRTRGLVYDTKTKQCRPSKRPGWSKRSKQHRTPPQSPPRQAPTSPPKRRTPPPEEAWQRPEGEAAPLVRGRTMPDWQCHNFLCQLFGKSKTGQSVSKRDYLRYMVRNKENVELKDQVQNVTGCWSQVGSKGWLCN